LICLEESAKHVLKNDDDVCARIFDNFKTHSAKTIALKLSMHPVLFTTVSILQHFHISS